ncbi:MAG TPA: hypothetical protein VET24_13200 [Actinomycetota bacterium]|nr:hypothetical protein [Actinomycetota bacterium]
MSDEGDPPFPIPGNFPLPLEHGLTPMEIASDEPLKAAERFFQALAGDDARGLWDCFGEQARSYVLNVGLERGMDFDLNSRLRQGTATDQEFEEFMGDLLQGVRRDLRGVDIQRLAFESQVEPETTLRVRVTYLVTLGEPGVGIVTAVPAGSLVMVLERDDWKVERIVPRPGGDLGGVVAQRKGNGHRS